MLRAWQKTLWWSAGMIVLITHSAWAVEQTVTPSRQTQAATTEQAAPQRVASKAEENALTIFDFESELEGWTIPDWAQTSADYAGKNLVASKEFASHGEGSAQIQVAFPGGKGTADMVGRARKAGLEVIEVKAKGGE